MSEEEIDYTAHGYMLLDDSCVLALDFAGGVDGVVQDSSGHNHHATVHGNPDFLDGGYPELEYEAPPEPTGNYMFTRDSSMYLVIPDSEELRLGDGDTEFTVSWAMR